MITAVVLSKNEEKNIIDCLETLDFCDEIILIDDNSSDRTVELARAKGAVIFKHSLNGNFSYQRNFGLSKASNEWVLFLDADERVSPQLAGEIAHFIGSQKEVRGVYIKRKDHIWGCTLKFGEVGNIKLLRLGKKDAGKWTGKVHEKWVVSGKTITFENSIIHYPHQTIEEFVREINYYTDIRSRELFEKNQQIRWYHVLFYPKAKFIQNFFLKLGFLDGIPGLIYALLMSFHSFLVRGKIWQLNQNKS